MHKRDDQHYTNEELPIFQHGYRKGRDIALAYVGVSVLAIMILFIVYASVYHQAQQDEQQRQREEQELLDYYRE